MCVVNFSITSYSSSSAATLEKCTKFSSPLLCSLCNTRQVLPFPPCGFQVSTFVATHSRHLSSESICLLKVLGTYVVTDSGTICSPDFYSRNFFSISMYKYFFFRLDVNDQCQIYVSDKKKQ